MFSKNVSSIPQTSTRLWKRFAGTYKSHHLTTALEDRFWVDGKRCQFISRFDCSVRWAPKLGSNVISENKAHQDKIPLINKTWLFPPDASQSTVTHQSRHQMLNVGRGDCTWKVGWERPSLEDPFGIETRLDKSRWLLAIRSLLPSDLMAKRSSGHMFTPFGKKYTEPTKQALRLWVIFSSIMLKAYSSSVRRRYHIIFPWEQIASGARPASLKLPSKRMLLVSSPYVPFHFSFLRCLPSHNGWMKRETGKLRNYYEIKIQNVWQGHPRSHLLGRISSKPVKLPRTPKITGSKVMPIPTRQANSLDDQEFNFKR